MQNTLFVLLDGMEDDPNPALGGKKPYQVAKMPFIRSKAPHLCWTTGRGYTQLFLNEFWTGHPPDTSRAALEAQGLGMDMSGGRTAFRLSPALIENGTVRWAYGVDDRSEALVQSIKSNLSILRDNDPEIRFFVHGRSVLTMRYDRSISEGPQAPVDGPYVPFGGKLQDLMTKIASENDGLTVYPWGIGKVGTVYPAFPQIGSMTAISNSPTALGIAASLGHRTELVEDLDERFPIAKKALKEGNVFLHMDEVDEYSHEKDHNKKIRTLEHIDSLMEEYFDNVGRLVFFVDHGTSCITGTHILTDVPFRTNLKCFRDGEYVSLPKVVPTLLEAAE